MILYTQTSSDAIAYQETIFFGDGTSTEKGAVVRANNPGGGKGTSIGNNTDINVFYFEHTYNAPGTYTVSYIGEYRNANVVNMNNSASQTFYIQTTFSLDPALGINHSPVLKAPAVDRAAKGQVFLHNPAAYDADGDSLSYRRIESRQVADGVDATLPPRGDYRPKVTICDNYTYPDAAKFGGTTVPFGGNPSGSPDAEAGKLGGGADPGGNPGTFTLNKYTGQIVWNAPNQTGFYNVAFIVEEWRRIPGAPPRRIGQVVRDMQIIVNPSSNLRPAIMIPTDTCVVAGRAFKGNVTATDPDNNPITLNAYSGIIPPATFRQLSNSPANRARGVFNWTPECANIASEPTQVVFKATDQPAAGVDPLIDEKVWRITVVGPPPTNLVAQRSTTNPAAAVLTWDRYACQNPGAQILIYRKENPSSFKPGPCETGIPASTGFVRIGAVAVDQRSFVDDRAGQGLERGKTYCYRIYVAFALPAGGASIASDEACITLDGASTIFTNVTVDRTDATNGQITVRWTKPRMATAFPLPLRYRLSRATGTSAAFDSVYTTFNLNDTVFVDQKGLNTRDNAYTYKLEFFTNNNSSGKPVPETPPTASSVRLSGQANEGATQVNLAWTYSVPWDNATPTRPTTIYRRDDPNSTTFVAVGTVPSGATGGSYVDRSPGLVRGQTYRYYVQTNGTYNNPKLPDNLLNKSQEVDVEYVPVPCAPVLTVENNCEALAATVLTRPGVFPAPGETYTNTLRWQLGSNSPAGCDNSDIDHYDLFYKLNGESSYQFLASTKEQQYAHTNLETQTYCYTVQAVNTYNRRSLQSDSACADNCLLFLLPNIFTPNGDGVNDTFRPKVASPLRRVHFTAYNRWGVKVYESQSNPRIDWSGEGANGEGTSGGKVSEGVYYYQAEVEFADLNGTKKTFKGWVQINR
ncbi:T9SS type B sorting domain-containing protein [Hymenobacter cavernae]|nr:gliding motility-associated C-terminal domain-containing protein [Hymenobacter cavernae]